MLCVGDRLEEVRWVAGEEESEGLESGSPVVNRNGEGAGFVQAERLDRPEVPGRLDHDGVPRVDQALRDQVEALLRAIHDLDLPCRHVEADPAAVAVGDELAEWPVPIGGSILEGRRADLGEDIGRRTRDPIGVEDRRRGEAPREGDHGRIGGDRKERPEKRGWDRSQATGKAVRRHAYTLGGAAG
ncbi:hypothetical protein DSECCO2_399660 [anaerobic digester metagenome]